MRTDVSGAFTVDAVAAGRYSGEVYAPGIDSSAVRFQFEARPPRAGGLALVLRGRRDVTGMVRGLAPEEWPQVVVHARSESSDGSGDFATGFIEPGGSYFLEGLTSGEWTIGAVFEGLAAKGALTVPEGGDSVYQGEPYEGVSVRLEAEDDLSPADRGVMDTTRGDGGFALGPVSAGTYLLTVWAPDWGRIHNQLVEVTDDSHLTLSLRAARASGQVLDSETGFPVQGAQVLLGQPDATYWVSHSVPDWADLDLEARFDIGPLEQGHWSLEALAEGYVASKLIIDVQGEDLEGIVLSLTPTPGLDVVLRTADAQVPEQVSLRLEEPEACRVVAETTLFPAGVAENRWADAPPGQWRLVAWDSTGACARVPAAIPGPEVEVTLPVLARLEVRVPDLEDEDIGATLRLFDETGRSATSRGCSDHGRSEWSVLVNRRFYAFGLPPGLYEARVTAADGRTWTGSVRVEPGPASAVTLN